MGFPLVEDEEKKIFTEYDVDVIRAHQDMMDEGLANSDTISSLVRAQSYSADRMVLWQYEALVEDAQESHGLDEVGARRHVLDHIDDYEEFLVYQMKYAWRRHMASFLRRAEVELEDMRVEPDEMPLQRALGFVDLVSYTDRSGKLLPHELVEFIQTFEFTCRDVIATHGARTVKMVGDAVLYIADDLRTGVEVVAGIVQALKDMPGMPDVRASLVWGGVVSRFGDVFGPNVNLASRLSAAADVGSILVDGKTADAINDLKDPRYIPIPVDIPPLHGIGKVEAAELTIRDNPQKNETNSAQS